MTNREKIIADNPILNGNVDIDNKIGIVGGKPVLCDLITGDECRRCRFNPYKSCVKSAKEWLDKEVKE